MKLKSLINFSDKFSITMLKNDLDNPNIQNYLKENNITFKILNQTRNIHCILVEFLGSKDNLNKLRKNFYKIDEELIEHFIKNDNDSYLMDSLDPQEDIIRIYKKGKDVVKMKKQEDNSILLTYKLSRPSGGGGLKYEFKTANEATRYLESTGWELDEIFENII